MFESIEVEITMANGDKEYIIFTKEDCFRMGIRSTNEAIALMERTCSKTSFLRVKPISRNLVRSVSTSNIISIQAKKAELASNIVSNYEVKGGNKNVYSTSIGRL